VEHDEGNPIADAEAQLYRRIQELRDRARAERRASVPSAPAEHGPGTPDLRTILSRAESHVGELRQKMPGGGFQEQSSRDVRGLRGWTSGLRATDPLSK